MKAKHPNTGRLEECQLLPAYHNGKDWVRFRDGREEPLSLLEGVQGVELERQIKTAPTFTAKVSSTAITFRFPGEDEDDS